MIAPNAKPNQFVQNLDDESRRNILEDEKVELIKKFAADIAEIERELTFLG